MLLDSEKKQLIKIKKELTKLSSKKQGPFSHKENRDLYQILRMTIHLYEDVVRRCHNQGLEPRGFEFRQLYRLAGEAINKIGGQGEPSISSLKLYDYVRYGPFLGVSDEGSAAKNIREAAFNSPKMQILGNVEPIQVGVAIDAERLAAVGEVAVGPDDYSKIRLECLGRILNSTNVGTRLNLRYFKKRPIIKIPGGTTQTAIKEAIGEAKAAVFPFLKTPDNIPRPITVFARFKTKRNKLNRLEILKTLNNAFYEGSFCKPAYHKLGLFITVCRGVAGIGRAKEAIDLAKEANLAEVTIEGQIRREAEDKISMPGLLNFFNSRQVAELLNHATKYKIPISPRNLVDTDTVARNVWCGLNTARNMGFELGKYGLFPLTLSEINSVMGMIQSWFSDWTAAPAFYVDFPVVDSSDVYTEHSIEEGLKKFLKIVTKHKIPVVLIDTADKDKGRKILKSGRSDKVGILLLDQIDSINKFANKIGIKILWAGGITMPQVYEFGKLGVFGIYVTSAASIARPVSKDYESDIMLSQEKEPTYEGVSRVKLLLEAGFLVFSLLRLGFKDIAETIDKKANKYITSFIANSYDENVTYEQDRLNKIVLEAWSVHFNHFL